MIHRAARSLFPLLLAVSLASFAAAAGVFNIMAESDPGGSKIDPGLGFSQYSPDLYLGLGRITPANEYAPGAALDYDVSEDGVTYTFHLRDDAFWSDGEPLTAHDFEFAWKRALDPETASSRAFMLFLIENGEAYNQGEATADAVGVTAVDDTTLQVTLTSAAPFFPLYASANNVYFPVPQHVVEQYGADWTQPGNHVASGPFKLNDWQPNLLLSLVPNELYPLEQPKIDELLVHIVPQTAVALSKFENGELDFTWNLPIGEMNRLRNDAALSEQLGYFAEANQSGLQFGLSFEPLDNKLVRKAIAMAVDPDPIIAGPLQHLVQRAGSVFVENVPGGRPDVALPYDPEQAKALLAEAGFPNGKGFPSISIVTRSSNPQGLASAQSVQAMLLANLNINIEVEALESAAYYDRLYSGNAALALTGPFSLTPDPYDLFNVLQGQLHNYQHWVDEEWDAKLAAATGEEDPEVRTRMYQELEDVIVRDETVFQPVYNGQRHSIQQPYVSNWLGWDQRNLWILTHEYVEVDN